MVSSSLANWDGSQSAQNQKPDRSMSRTIQAIPVAAHSAKARLEELSGEVFNASFKKTEVNGRAGLERIVPEQELQVSYTPKDDVSRMFNGTEPDIPNGHSREDDTYSLTDKDAEGETVDGDDAMAVDDDLGAPSSSPSQTSRDAKTHMDSYGSPLSSSLRSGDDAGGIFTPPPGQTYDSVLTPSSSQTRASPPRKRVIISHVDVPRLPRDSDPTTYRPIAFKEKPRPLPLPLVKRKRVQSQPGIKSHQDLGTALQAAMNNNGALQTVSRQRLQATNNPTVGSSSSSSISSPYISASETVRQKTRRQEHKREPEWVDEGVHRQNKAKSAPNPVTRYASGSRSTSVSVMFFRSELEGTPPSVSVPPPVRAPAPRPSVASPEYDSMKDMVELVMTSIPEPSWPVLELNTRFFEHRPRSPLRKDNWNAVAMPLPPAKDSAGKAPESESEEQHMESSIAGVPDDDMTTGGYVEVWKEGEASEHEESDEDEGSESGDEEEEIVFLGMRNAEQELKRQVNVPRPRENVSASKNAEIPPRHIRVADPVGTSEGWSFPQELPRPHRKLHSRPSIQYSASPQREKQRQPSKQHEKQKELAEKDTTHRVSEKALGKRRAMSPELWEDPRARPSPSVSSASHRMPAKHAASVKSMPHPTAPASQSPRTPGASARLAANPNSASAIPNTVLAAALSSPPNIPPPPYALISPALISQASPTAALRRTGTVAGSVSPSHKRPVANMRPTPRAPTAASPSRAPAARSPSARTPSIQSPVNVSQTSPSHRRPPANTAMRRLSGPNPPHLHTPLTHSVSTSPMLPATPTQPNVHGYPGHRPSASGTAPATQSHSTRLPPWAIQWSVPVPDILPTHSSSHGQPATGAHSNIHELPEHDPPSASRIPALHVHSVVNANLADYSPPNHNAIPISPSISITMPSPHHPHPPSFAHPHLLHMLPNAHAPSASHLPEPSPFFAHTNARDSDSPFLANYDTEPESSNKLYNYSSIGPDDGTRNDHTHSSTAGANDLLLEDGRHDLEGPSAWVDDDLSAMELVPGFVNGTIDPSLLGGGQPADEHASIQPLVQYASDSASPPPFPASPPAASSSIYPLVTYESRSPSAAQGPSHHQSPASHRSRSSSRSLSPTRSVQDSQGSSRSAQSNYASNDAASSSSSSQPLTRRLPRPRRTPNGMIATGDLDLSSSDESWSPSGRKRLHRNKPAKRSMTRKPNQSSDPDEEEEVPLAQTVSESSHEKPAAPLAGGWLRQEELDYCHQCRRKTAILKLICPCEKKYCVRCLTLRYTGDMAYDLTRANFTCPLCKNSCNCDVCCRKRGEDYVSFRSYSRPSAKRPAGREPKESPNPPPHLTRPRLGGKTNLPAPAAVAGPLTYWATMYSFNGEIIGNAFTGDGGNEEVVVVRPLGEVASERKRERIFVGEVQEAWGLGDQCLVKDVDPISWRDRNHRPPNERVYIGKKAPLYERTAPMAQPPPVHADTAVHNQFAYDGDDGFSSPLSSIEDDSDGEGPGEGESRLGLEPSVTEADFEVVAQGGLDSFLAKGPGKAFSVDSLLDTDVARAISLGLLACGVAVQLSAC